MQLAISLADAGVIYVNRGATGSFDGLTWGTALTSVQQGLDRAVAGDRVWVAAGIYFENVTLKDGVALYGGFSGNETALSQRNWTTNLSILDGNNTNTVVLVPVGVTNTTRIDGFTIRNGYASGGGGGIYCSDTSPAIANNVISHNSTANYGGGIACDFGSPVITNNIITENMAIVDGAGIECFGATPFIANNRISGNHTAHSLPPTFTSPFGAGISCLESSPTIINNFLIGNYADALAGSSVGGGIYCSAGGTPLIINNTFLANSAQSGGAIYCLNNQVVLANNLIAFNSSGIVGSNGMVIANNCVYGNSKSDFLGLTNNPIGTNGNISVDPHLTTNSFYLDVHLLPDSPCIDAGNSNYVQSSWSDIDGQPRIQGVTVDIGADESDGSTFVITPRIMRVGSGGNDANNGSSWALAKRTVQAAINALPDTGGEVWAQAGTYPERITAGIFTYLFGGFNGTETDRSQRNWNTNITTLDGGLGGTVVTLAYMGQWGGLDGFSVMNGMAPGGAAGVYCIYSGPFIAHNNISFNSVTNSYFSAAGGGIYFDLYSSPTITNNLIANNQAPEGGGIACLAGSSFIANNVFKNNLATGPGGGALFSNEGNLVIANNLFADNIATTTANTGANGNTIYCTGGTQLIANNTFLRNLNLTGGHYVGAAIYCSSPSPRIFNNLIAYGTAGLEIISANPIIHNNCVYGNDFGNYWGMTDQTGTNGNISVDPLLTGLYGDPHLLAGSPCIDAGDNSVVQTNWTDLDGNPRVFGTTVDIGADEYDGTTFSVPTRIFYVSPTGNDNSDGLSWATAKQSVHAGITAAAYDGGEVWVRSGTYPENLIMEAFVYLYGGFAGNESSRSQRNWLTNVTVLDGGLAGTVVTLTGASGYNALSGFTIQNGLAPAFASSTAGGIYCRKLNTGLIANNRIVNNQVGPLIHPLNSGAGIYCGGSPVIINNLIADNMAVSSSIGAGGIFCDTNALPLIANNTIISNLTENGGAIYFNHASPLLVNDLVAFNILGIFNNGGSAIPRNNCVFGNRGFDYSGLSAGPNSLSVNPQLFDQKANFFLRPGSPCINTGDNSVVQPDWLDIYGRPRVQDGTVDIGAFESQSTPEWMPLLLAPAISVTTTGGITYAQYSATLTNDAFQFLGAGPLARSGTNFAQDFRFQWFTGPAQPVTNVIADATPLGHLPGGSYTFATESWGLPLGTNLFTVSTNADPTLSGLAGGSGGAFQMNVAGVSNATYVVEASTNLVDWIGISTNRGAPFTFNNPAGGDYEQRFFRVLILP